MNISCCWLLLLISFTLLTGCPLHLDALMVVHTWCVSCVIFSAETDCTLFQYVQLHVNHTWEYNLPGCDTTADQFFRHQMGSSMPFAQTLRTIYPFPFSLCLRPLVRCTVYYLHL